MNISSVFQKTKSGRKSSKKRGCKHSQTGYYNDLNVVPGIEALEKMRVFYTAKGIEIFKYPVNLPGMSLDYLLGGLIERAAELYSPCKEAYGMLKEAVGG